MEKHQTVTQEGTAQLVRMGARIYRVRTQIIVDEIDSNDAPGNTEVRQGTEQGLRKGLPGLKLRGTTAEHSHMGARSLDSPARDACTAPCSLTAQSRGSARVCRA